MREKRVKAYRRGLFAETVAALLLRLKGYAIVARRYKTPVGEIDLVALKGKRLAFVEVKRRKTKRGRRLDAAGRAAAAHRQGRAILARRRTPTSPATTSLSTWCWRRPGPLAALYRGSALIRSAAIRARHGPQSRLPDGPDRAHRYQGRFDLRPAARSAMARPRRVLLHARQSLAARRQADRARATASRSRTSPAIITGWRIRGARRSRRSSTWCSCARTRPSTWPISPPRICSSGIQPQTLVVNDPAARAQRAGESVRARFSRSDAADPRHPLDRDADRAPSAPSTRTSW